MRPLRLSIKGLASFRKEQQIDFEDLDLFAIIGPTGAGKTTILDAVVLGLYGKIPRTGGRNTGEFVTHGEARATLLLEFRANGQIYRVGRELPRNGAQRASLERREGDSWLPAVSESGVKAVNACIEDIVGLDFEAFTRAVLLPQGEFARFLSGNAQERRDILVRLLDLGRYEKAGQLARDEANVLKRSVESQEDLVARTFAGANEEAVETAIEAAEKAAARARDIAKGSQEIGRLVRSLEGIEGQTKELDGHAATLNRTGAELAAIATAWEELGPQLAETDGQISKAQVAMDGARTRRQKAELHLEKVRT
jgi:exonuclease SbcC